MIDDGCDKSEAIREGIEERRRKNESEPTRMEGGCRNVEVDCSRRRPNAHMLCTPEHRPAAAAIILWICEHVGRSVEATNNGIKLEDE